MRYGQYPPQTNQYNNLLHGPRPQVHKLQHQRGSCMGQPHTHNPPRHQNTTVFNQAFTFNEMTPQASINYTPGTFNIGPVNQNWGPQFTPQYQILYHYQFGNQPQPQLQNFNSFMQNQGNNPNTNHMQTENAATLQDQPAKLLNTTKSHCTKCKKSKPLFSPPADNGTATRQQTFHRTRAMRLSD